MAERLRRGGHEVVGYDAFAADKSDVASLADRRRRARRARELASCGSWSRPARRPSRWSTDAGRPARRRRPRHRRRQHPLHRLDPPRRGELGGARHRLHRLRHERRRVGPRQRLLPHGRRGRRRRGQGPARSSTPSRREGGFAHVGPVGAGHFTKMVHNGIEYGMMQAFAEGVALLEKSELGIDAVGGAVGVAARERRALVAARPPRRCARAQPRPPRHRARWPRTPARAAGRSRSRSASASPRPVIAASLCARFGSQDERNLADEGHRRPPARQFGGHAVRPDAHERPDGATRATSATRLVLFGATGDLARKKLFPAVYDMQRNGTLDGMPVIGVVVLGLDRRRPPRAGPGRGARAAARASRSTRRR